MPTLISVKQLNSQELYNLISGTVTGVAEAIIDEKLNDYPSIVSGQSGILGCISGGTLYLSSDSQYFDSNYLSSENQSLIPTSGEKAALAGSDGFPSSGNKFLTQSDPDYIDAAKKAAPNTFGAKNTFTDDVEIGGSSANKVTFNAGEIKAANATDTSADRIANVGTLRSLDLEDWHTMRCLEIGVDQSNFAKYVNNASFDSGNVRHILGRTQSNAGAAFVATTWTSQGVADSLQFVGDFGSSPNVVLNKKIIVSFIFGFDDPTGDGIFTVDISGHSTRATTATPRAMDRVGFGLKIENMTVYGVTHNGTTAVTSPALLTLPGSRFARFYAYLDGSGGVLYKLLYEGVEYTQSSGTTIPTLYPISISAVEMSANNNNDANIRWLALASMRVTINR